MTRRHPTIFLSLLALGLAACAMLNQAIKEPTISFLDLTRGDFLFNFEVHNPNPLGLKLSRMSWGLTINQKQVAKSSHEKDLHLPARGTAIMSLPVSVRYLELFKNAADFLAAKSIAYELLGSARVGPFTIPYRKSGTLDLPRLPSVSVESIHLGNLSLSSAALSLTLSIRNPNDFDVDLQGLNYAFKLQGRELAKGALKTTTQIAKKGETQLSLDLDLSFSELGRSVSAILQGQSAPYQISGEMLLNSSDGTGRRVPFQSSGRIPPP
jgi:LEA14-like dessication related protein